MMFHAQSYETPTIPMERWYTECGGDLCRMQLPDDQLPADPAPFGVSIFQWWTQSIVPSLIRCYKAGATRLSSLRCSNSLLSIFLL